MPSFHGLTRLLIVVLFVAPCLVACGGDDVPATQTSAPTEVAVNTPGASAPSPSAESVTAMTETAVDGTIRVAASAGNYLYVVTSAGVRDAAQLQVFEVAGDGSTQQVGSLDSKVTVMPASIGVLSRAAVVGDTLFVPLPTEDGSGGLWVVDVSDPAVPMEIALIETELPPLSVVVSGDVAVVAPMSFTGPLRFFDISDPANAMPTGELDVSLVSMPPAIEFAGTRLYVADARGVQLIDASDPNQPHQIGTYENADFELLMGTSEESSSGVISSVSDSVVRSGTFTDIAAAGDRLLVGTSEGVQIVDVSDPANPEEVEQLDVSGAAWRIAAASDGTAYVYAIGDLVEDQPMVQSVVTVDLADGAEPDIVATDDVRMTFPPQMLMTRDDGLVLAAHSAIYVLRVVADTEASSGDIDFAPVQMFDSLAEAQEVVPFEILPPELPGDFSIHVIQVLGAEPQNVSGSQVIVDIQYGDADDTGVRFAVGNRAVTPWSKEGNPQFTQEREEFVVDGVDVVGITATSEAGMVGYIYWKSGDLTYQLWYPGKPASELTSFVAS